MEPVKKRTKRNWQEEGGLMDEGWKQQEKTKEGRKGRNEEEGRGRKEGDLVRRRRNGEE
jgi:hypothetical protein